MMFHSTGLTATVTSSGIVLRGGGIGGVFFTTLAVLTVAAYTVYVFATTLVVLVLPRRRFVVCMVHGLAIVAAITIFRS